MPINAELGLLGKQRILELALLTKIMEIMLN